ncbi:uncharacterized protein LTR77_007922 [Saxophila tyrrhenica]|uniref:RNA polymerase II subunit B1 CTD phosphatase RPAP2 homolog n=1 Tax=Saxophila tyrrhenica TaxID=1690608 RepID=A0AAV9P3V5_9PEZI|nr:hypothetical protein LTR77_007922 [Saxophila tyrrhenica]
METTTPARSILKQPSAQPTLSDEQKATAATNKRHLTTALYHANKIQQRKDVEARIFGNIETLLEFPSATPFTSVDVSRLVSLARLFQPSDFDNLVEERRIDGKCGYALCSNPPRSESLGTSAAWKLKAKAHGDYCSDTCTRKSLYVKTQLSEVPAWEREPGYHPKIVVHPDDRMPTSRSSNPFIASAPRANHHELALERGDTTSSMRPSQVMASTVVENGGASPIEGYEPLSAATERPTPSAPPAQAQGTSANQASAGDYDEEAESWRDLYSNMPER